MGKESDVASISSNATKTRLKSKAKPTPKPRRFTPQLFGAADSQELYTFLRSLDVMRAAFEKDTTAVLSTNSDLGRMLNRWPKPCSEIPPH